MIKQWEYKVLDKPPTHNEPQQELLNVLGDQGWELVSVVDTESYKHPRFYFKREKSIPLPTL